MIFSISQNELFNILQSEKFVIGKALFAKSLCMIEKISNRSVKEEVLSEKLLENFKKLRNKWKKLEGGSRRANFKENNLSHNFVFKIDDKEFSSEPVDVEHESVTEVYNNLNLIKPNEETRETASNKRFNNRREIQKIQKSLLLLNKQLFKETGYCFEKVQLCNSKLHKYGGAFKGYKKR
jgi:hypothetical protein